MKTNIIGNSSITDIDLERITNNIINILANENITHAVADVILNNVKEKLKDTIVNKCV